MPCNANGWMQNGTAPPPGCGKDGGWPSQALAGVMADVVAAEVEKEAGV